MLPADGNRLSVSEMASSKGSCCNNADGFDVVRCCVASGEDMGDEVDRGVLQTGPRNSGRPQVFF